ncbi:hypothetical protein VTH82DRAFT_6252 [Thermothelomyces myriococcoides]
MAWITERGLEHMEKKRLSITLAGHEIVLRDVASSAAKIMAWADEFIKPAVRELPYAAIVMAGVSLVLPLLANPPAAEAANQQGFKNVTEKIRYYGTMEQLLLPGSMNDDVKDNLAGRLVNLYKHVIDFQIRTVLRFYRSRTKQILRDVANYDGWSEQLNRIEAIDNELMSKGFSAGSRSSSIVTMTVGKMRRMYQNNTLWDTKPMWKLY